MDQTDSFIEEVTEEVRRDRLFAIFKKYGWIGIVAILAVVGGSAWVEWQKSREQAAAEAFGDALLAAVQSENPGDALSTVSAEGQRADVVKLMAAAQAVQDDKAEAALADLQAVAADASLPASLRDLARLKAVIVAGDKMDGAKRVAELEDLAKPGGAYRLMALEQQAIDAMAAGDKDGAIAKAREILAEDGVTSGLHERATQLIVALGGDPAAQ